MVSQWKKGNIISKIVIVNILGFVLIIAAQLCFEYLHTLEIKEYIFKIEAERIKKTSEVFIEEKIRSAANILNSFAMWDKLYQKVKERDITWLKAMFEDDPQIEKFDAFGIYEEDGKPLYTKGLILDKNTVNKILEDLRERYKPNEIINSFLYFFYRSKNDVFFMAISPLGDNFSRLKSYDFLFFALSVRKIVGIIKEIFPHTQLILVSNFKSSDGYAVPLKDLDGSVVAFIHIPIPQDIKAGFRRIVIVGVFLGIFLLVCVIFIILTLRTYYKRIKEEVKYLALAIDSIGALKPDMLKLKELSFKNGEIGDVFKSILSTAESVIYSVFRDPLTGAYNRKFFFERLREELERVKRYKRPLSVALLDVDNFKRINDKFGHPFGDKVLKTIASLIMSRERSTDLFARVGGEEFGIILPETDIYGAQRVCERLRRDIENLNFDIAGEKVKVTVSFGATQAKETDTTESLYERADRALYMAKRSGKNRVVILY